MEGNNALKEKQNKKNQVLLETAMHNVEGPNVATNEVVNIAAEEGHLPVWITPEPDLEAVVFVKNFSTRSEPF